YPHEESEEKYLSVERTRNGFKIVYSPIGGVDVEAHSESVKHYDSIYDAPLPRDFLERTLGVMNSEHLSFVEINPLIVRGEECILLDAAVLADSAASGQANWNEEDVVE